MFIQINISTATIRSRSSWRWRMAFVRATEGQRTIRRAIGCMGADDPTLRVLIAFFDSKEDAKANSLLPGTDQVASKLMGIIKEDMPQFVNLEVKSDRTF